MIREILFCYKEDKKLRIRKSILTDVFVPVQDVISPQKTTLKILKTPEIEISDIIIIRDNDSGKIEYIGYIDTIKTKTTTEIFCYPLINVFDNDYVLTQMYEETTNEDGETVDSEVDVYNWLKKNLENVFVKAQVYNYNLDTSKFDPYQALPLIIRNKLKKTVFYKKALDTSNLFEVYTDLFINTGVYIEFNELSYDGIYIDGIYCDIYCNNDEEPIYLREDNPQIQNVEIVDNTFTNYNKLIAIQSQKEDENGNLVPATNSLQKYTFFLLEDNSITTDPNASGRFKQVRSKIMSFDVEEYSNEEKKQLKEELNLANNVLVEVEIKKRQAKALMLKVYNELQAKEYNLAITITMFKNDRIKLHKMVDFVAESGTIYTSRITKLEILNDKQIKITLGALRNSLTDFKKKVEAI